MSLHTSKMLTLWVEKTKTNIFAMEEVSLCVHEDHGQVPYLRHYNPLLGQLLDTNLSQIQNLDGR